MTPYYEQDGITIYHGDCLDVLRGMEDDSVGAVVTDPPYNVGVRYGEGTDDRNPDYWEWLDTRLKESRRVAPVVAFTHKVSALRHITDWDWVGAWTKPLSTGARLGNSPLLPHWEPIFMYGIHTLGTKSTFAPDVFSVNPQRVKGTSHMRGREGWATLEAENHPTPKPMELMLRLVGTLGQLTDTILDPFMGSGTTLRAAKDLGKRAIGVEIEERYCEFAVERLAQGVLQFDGVSG